MTSVERVSPMRLLVNLILKQKLEIWFIDTYIKGQNREQFKESTSSVSFGVRLGLIDTRCTNQKFLFCFGLGFQRLED